MMGGRILSVMFLLVALSCNSFGFKQTLTLHLKGGNSLLFDQNTPDTTDYAALFPKVEKFCTVGRWYTFDGVNYKNASFTLGNAAKTEPVCIDYKDSSILSIRHLGNEDTDVDQISLYEGIYFEGKETVVTGRALTGIPHTVQSLAATGSSDWMLFSGDYLDGTSVCYKVPYEGWCMNYHVTLITLNIGKIGSVFRSCDLPEIQAYKDEHLLA